MTQTRIISILIVFTLVYMATIVFFAGEMEPLKNNSDTIATYVGRSEKVLLAANASELVRVIGPWLYWGRSLHY